MNSWLALVAVALCAASISFTVTMAGMFEGFRNWVYNKSNFFGKLITCPYCFGHYVIFIILGIGWFGNIPFLAVMEFDGTWFPRLFNFLFTSFTVIGAMALFHYIIILAYEPVMKIKAQREVAKLRDAKLKENKS